MRLVGFRAWPSKHWCLYRSFLFHTGVCQGGIVPLDPAFYPKWIQYTTLSLYPCFFNFHPRPLGPAGPDNLRYSSWKIGSVDQTRSGSTMFLHSWQMKDWFSSPRSSSTLICTIHEIFSLCCLGDSHNCVNKHASNCLPAISVWVCERVCNSCIFLMNNGFEQESPKVLRQTLTLVRKWALILIEACSIIPYFSYLVPSGAAITRLIAHTSRRNS